VKPEPAPLIGTLNENSLHADLKTWFAIPGDRLEVKVDGYVVDILRGQSIFEIQTGNFSSIRRKLKSLTRDHYLQLIYPIAATKWIIKNDGNEKATNRRKSPKRGEIVDVFHELVSIPTMIRRNKFSVRVCLIHSEEIREKSDSWSWRTKGWKTVEQRLLEVVGEREFKTPLDFAHLLPPDTPEIFTTKDLALALARPRRLAQRMTYCLREMGMITAVGRQGNAIRYQRTFTPVSD
jgi:hypothetical protein